MRVEEMRVKRRDAEQWMSHRMLPEKLKERIRRYDQYKWQETRGVEEETLVRNLPKDLRKDIKRHLCLSLVKRVSVSTKNVIIFISPSITRYLQFFITLIFLRCHCSRKWMIGWWMPCVIISSQFFSQTIPSSSERVTQLMRCSLLCVEI